MPGFRRFTLAALLFAALPAHAEYLSVHLGYIVPGARRPQPSAETNLLEAAHLTQAWYAEQMDRWGFGPKTFRLESSGEVHTIATSKTAAEIRQDVWAQNIDAASDAGIPVWAQGQVWFLASNSHQMYSDGEVAGDTALGGSFGSGADGGVAMLGGNAIPNLSLAALKNETRYDGLVINEIGPYPLKQDVSHHWFEGTTISSVASSLLGAMAHELGHAFGLPHTSLNDNNFDGPLMGNGLRGFRGVLAPDQFTSDDTWLSYASALALSTSRYFDPDATYTDNVKPTVSVTTSGSVALTNGQLRVDFTASDTSGLSAAVLLRNGTVVGAAELGEATRTRGAAITTPYFEAGVAANFELRVYDTQGNLQTRTVSITPQASGNLAPQPFVRTDQTIVRAGESFSLSAAGSDDPDSSHSLKVEWDLDGDGVFDTTPSSNLSLVTNFDTPGVRRVVARVTDALGASALSSPIAVRVLGDPGDYNGDGLVDASDYAMWKNGFGGFAVPHFGGDGTGDAHVNLADYTLWRDQFAPIGTRSVVASTTIPEPSTLLLTLTAVAGFMVKRRAA